MATLPDDKTLPATVAYVDAKGNPATVDGAPVWASSNEGVATVAAAADGMSASIVPGSTLGDTDITVTADADLGSGIVQLIATGTVTVVAGQAVTGAITFGTPV